MTDLDALNAEFGLETLSFEAGPNTMPVARIKNAHATATIALQGAHVTEFTPHGQQPILWVSQSAEYRSGKAIRGGIPICWPWFADHPTDAGKPAHGFVRIMPLSVAGTTTLTDGSTRISFALTENSATRALWPYPFRLAVTITIAEKLTVSLLCRNPGDEPFTVGSALHSYFNISDVGEVIIRGLAGAPYLDKVVGMAQQVQQGNITIEGETDRIYLETEATCVIEDHGWQRQIYVAKVGSQSTVVWNPWAENAAAMGDFDDEGYRHMVCVETTNAANDVITLPPGGEHRLATIIHAEAV